MLSVKWSTAGSAIRPPGTILRPICIRPLRKVPAVMITALPRSSQPQMVFTPMTDFPDAPDIPGFTESSTKSSSAWSCQMSRLAVSSSLRRHSHMNLPRSHWALGLHMAGPFERLSIRNWMAVASVTKAICPPMASISRTICPLAIPPIAGLHDICAILFMSMVTKQVFAPMLAAAQAASQPACPPPMTSTSYFNIITYHSSLITSSVPSCNYSSRYHPSHL